MTITVTDVAEEAESSRQQRKQLTAAGTAAYGGRRRRHPRRRRRRCLMCARRYIQISVTSYKMHLDLLNHLEESLKQVFLQRGGGGGASTWIDAPAGEKDRPGNPDMDHPAAPLGGAPLQNTFYSATQREFHRFHWLKHVTTSTTNTNTYTSNTTTTTC